MSNRVKICRKIRQPMCHRCNSKYGGKHYLAYKEVSGGFVVNVDITER